MREAIEVFELKIKELENIKKRCQEESYLKIGMLSNYAMRDFLEWHLKDLKLILKTIKNN